MATVSAMFTITDTGDLSGRNLLQRAFFTKEPWTGPTYNAVGDGFGIYHDKYCLPVTTRWLYVNTNKGVDNLFPDLVFEEGVQYTLSGKWAQFRTDNKFNKMYLRIHHTDGTMVSINQPNQNNAWSPFTLTSTAGKTVDKIVTTFSSEGATYIENFKLEVGKAATDWTPAPEDVVTAMETANTAKTTAESKNSVYYQTSAPTGKKVGDTWFDTNDGNKIYRWNGSTWVAAELGDQAIGNLNASHINAGTLTAVDIEAGKAQDISGTIKVYDEDDAVQVSLDKDGLTATKGNVGGWNIGEKTLESDHVTGVDESGVEHTGKSSLDVEGGLEIVGSSTTAFVPDIYQRGWHPPSTVSLWGESYIGPRSISSEYLVAKNKAVSNGGFWIPGRNISAWYTLTPRKQIANTGIYFTLYTKGDLSLFWLILDGNTPEWTAGVKNNVATSLVDYVDSSTAHFINSVQRSQVAPPYTIWLVNGRGVGSTSGRGGVCNNYAQEIQPYISTDGYINIYRATTNTSVAAITANVFWAHIDYPYTES